MSKVVRRDWQESELLKVISLYHQIPFGRMHARAPEVIALSKIIGRSPSAVALKLVNFASLDQTLIKRGIKGMRNTSKLDQRVWETYHNNWHSLADAFSTGSDEKSEPELIEEKILQTDRTALAKVRVGQEFFRRSVMANFGGKCCLTGISCPDLLRASHIIPWSHNQEQRLNPKNGLLLNSILDAAFDKGWITLDENHRAVVSSKLRKDMPQKIFFNYFQEIHRKQISPERFFPEKDFIKYHYEKIFQGDPL